MYFSDNLTTWFSKNKRTLPWRENRTPYRVWLSEIILQQTRVDQGLSYFHRFTEKYPTASALATAPESEVLKLWQGLGYYSRARNLHHAARQVQEDFGGVFPTNFNDLLKLKGVGPYSAAAIASICFGEKVPVLDGNVYRFLGRHFGIDAPIDTTPGQKVFRTLAEELIPSKAPGEFNEAMMEFGATVCTPKAPNCDNCPFITTCIAYRDGRIDEIPVKSKKTRVKPLYLEYFVIHTPEGFVMQRRPQRGIWGGMYDFPGSASERKLSRTSLHEQQHRLGLDGLVPTTSSDWYAHLLTHRRISARFHHYEIKGPTPLKGVTFVSVPEDLEGLALPRLIEKYIAECIFPITGKL